MKYFPIKTATACQLKWTWSTVFLNDGTTSSCHRVGRHPIPSDNFDSFHNTPEKLEQRTTMLEGKWPQPLSYMSDDKGCRYCEKIENAGGHSDRMFHLQIPDLSPKELDTNPNSIVVTPKILEVFFGNTCNLKCTYCVAANSSQIEMENVKYGDFSKNGFELLATRVDRELNAKNVDNFFKWLDNNHHELRRLHVLGGEPLYQKEFYRCIEFFSKNPNPELEFNFVTNLMLDPSKFKDLVLQLKKLIAKRHFKRLDITVSLDCWGPEQEYARHGIKLDIIEQNMQLLLKEKWIYLNINSTLSPLTLKTLPDLITQINTWRQTTTINHHFQTVLEPAAHNPDIFGGDFWQTDLDRALSLMPQDSWQEKNSYNYLQGIFASIQNSCKNTEMIVQFITHLDELDRRRGTNWEITFPWLKEYKKYVV